MKPLAEPSSFPAAFAHAISPRRDHLQSQILVWGWIFTVLPLVNLIISVHIISSFQEGGLFTSLEMHGVYVCVALSCIVVALRAATPAAAAAGGFICYCMTLVERPTATRLMHTALPALLTLFVLTYAATRLGRARKLRLGLAESHRGRKARQIIANLGFASAASFVQEITPAIQPACLAALAEATADTLSSELGPLIPGPTLLLTTLRRVPAGTDGGISLGGTLCGLAGAAIVVAVGISSLNLGLLEAKIAFGSAVIGLFTDSLLGATLERRGLIGNDWVNFLSTVIAAVTAFLLCVFYRLNT
jgi:uncharacterized protein (TIGR00297 family)